MKETLEELKRQKREIDAKIRALEKEMSETVLGNFRLKHQPGEHVWERKEWFWSVSLKQITSTGEQRWTRIFICKTMDEVISKVKTLANEALDFSDFLQNNVREEG